MNKISDEEAEKLYGLRNLHEQMPNGELRFRLIDKNGLGYIRTEAGKSGAWQNSHFHMKLLETYIVQTGWIAIATLNGSGGVAIRVLRSDDIWTSPIGLAHNIYMPAGSVTHVVKHGEHMEKDWHTNDETEMLDAMTKIMSEADLQPL